MERSGISGVSGRTVRAVTPLADYQLLLEFDNGAKRIYDVAPLLKFDAFASLRDVALFQQAHVIFDYTVGWNDDMDICPDCLYEHSIPASFQ